MNQPIYLDHNATTPLSSGVLDAMLPYLREHFGNPSSGHVYGRRAAEAIAKARQQVASLLGCDPDEIVFTSGGTEANNLALRGAAEAAPAGRRRVVTTVIEHPATERPCGWLERSGFEIVRLGVDHEGVARIDPAAIDERTALVSVMHSNNETGVLQPVGELTSLAHAAGALCHTDAAQSAGKVPLDVRALGVDLLSVAGHKLYAPKGIGFLYVRRGVVLRPFMLGAGHERGLRPGTENVASIVGLGQACAEAHAGLDESAARMRRLREQLQGLLGEAVPGLTLNGHRELRLPNTLNVRFPEISGTVVLAGAPEVAASTGSACHDGHEQPSGVILAMGVAPGEATGSVRLTLGRSTTEDDVQRAAAALIRAWQEARA